MIQPQLPSAIDKALSQFPPEIQIEAKDSLAEFLKFSKQQTSDNENPWSQSEALAFLAGYVSGRANRVIRNN